MYFWWSTWVLLWHDNKHPGFFSLHIRSMWETICDAWACWSGWNFGPNSSRIPPILKYSFRIPPLKMKIVRESKSESFRTPPNENCQRVQIWQFQNTPPKMKIVRESKSESFRIPPQKMKIVRESKSESFRIPPSKMKIVTESKSESFITPPKWKLSESPNPRVSEYPPKWKLSESPNLRVSEYPPKMKIVRESKSESFRIPPPKSEKLQVFKLQNSLKIREIYVETNL